jgi:hypothetical protein
MALNLRFGNGVLPFEQIERWPNGIDRIKHLLRLLRRNFK